MSRRFLRSIRKAPNFSAWLERLKMFNCSLIKENGLQMWTVADFKNYWTQSGRTI